MGYKHQVIKGDYNAFGYKRWILASSYKKVGIKIVKMLLVIKGGY